MGLTSAFAQVTLRRTKNFLLGQPSITVSALSRHTSSDRRILGFPSWKILVLLCFAHDDPKLAFQNPTMELGSTNHLFGLLLPTMIRCSDSPTARGGKAPNHSNDVSCPPGCPAGYLPCDPAAHSPSGCAASSTS